MGRKTRGSANAETEIVGMGADNKSGAEFQSLEI
jgi:hypothetical protein